MLGSESNAKEARNQNHYTEQERVWLIMLTAMTAVVFLLILKVTRYNRYNHMFIQEFRTT